MQMFLARSGPIRSIAFIPVEVGTLANFDGSVPVSTTFK